MIPNHFPVKLKPLPLDAHISSEMHRRAREGDREGDREAHVACTKLIDPAMYLSCISSPEDEEEEEEGSESRMHRKKKSDPLSLLLRQLLLLSPHLCIAKWVIWVYRTTVTRIFCRVSILMVPLHKDSSQSKWTILLFLYHLISCGSNKCMPSSSVGDY